MEASLVAPSVANIYLLKTAEKKLEGGGGTCHPGEGHLILGWNVRGTFSHSDRTCLPEWRSSSAFLAHCNISTSRTWASEIDQRWKYVSGPRAKRYSIPVTQFGTRKAKLPFANKRPRPWKANENEGIKIPAKMIRKTLLSICDARLFECFYNNTSHKIREKY